MDSKRVLGRGSNAPPACSHGIIGFEMEAVQGDFVSLTAQVSSPYA
jgi:hypothetical protein